MSPTTTAARIRARTSTGRAAAAAAGALLLTAAAGCGTATDDPAAAPPEAPATSPPAATASPAPPATSTTGPSSGQDGGDDSGQAVTADLVMQVTEIHEATGMTLLEGPVFGPDGDLYLVDVTAPPGQPKVLRVDLATGDVFPVYTDETSAFTSAQINPADGRLYLTDLINGEVESITTDGQDPQVVFSGPVEGAVMVPDDISFDQDGNAYLSDTTGFDTPDGPDQGRVVRVDHESGEATVLADELPAPNGISFTTDFSALLVSGYTANRIDRLELTGDRTQVTSTSTFAQLDVTPAQIDSTAVDADGNFYQALHNRPGLVVLDATGQQIATIDADIGTGQDHSATNMAIRPGTGQAYMTVSGPTGGFLYSFDALADSTRQSNGG